MRIAPGEFTTAAGGGADTTAAVATLNFAGNLLTAITAGPDVSTGCGATAASSVTPGFSVTGNSDGPPPAPAATKTGGTITATAAAGDRERPPAERRAQSDFRRIHSALLGAGSAASSSESAS